VSVKVVVFIYSPLAETPEGRNHLVYSVGTFEISALVRSYDHMIYLRMSLRLVRICRII
jgi:hypothetical protein